LYGPLLYFCPFDITFIQFLHLRERVLGVGGFCCWCYTCSVVIKFEMIPSWFTQQQLSQPAQLVRSLQCFTLCKHMHLLLTKVGACHCGLWCSREGEDGNCDSATLPTLCHHPHTCTALLNSPCCSYNDIHGYC